MYCCKFPGVILISLYASSVLLEKINNGKGCFYKGAFHHGNWTDGCEFNCTCLDTDKGHYKCHTRCPVYPQLPPGCVLKLPIGEECCQQPDCSAVTVPYTINNNNNNDNGNNNNISNNENNGYNNSDNNGSSDETNSTKIEDLIGSFNNASITEYGEQTGCFYKGKYHYGNWTDGCEFNCSCEDPVLGTYRCRKRCREYTELEPGCTLKLPSDNECCRIPECNSTNTATNTSDTYVNNIRNNKNDFHSIKPNIHSNYKTTTTTTLPPIIVGVTRTTSLPEIFPSKVANGNQLTKTIDTEVVGYKLLNKTNKTNTKDAEVLSATETEKLAIIFSRFGPVRLFTVAKNNDVIYANKDRKDTTIDSATANGILPGQQNVIPKSEKGFTNRTNDQRDNITGTGESSANISHINTGGVCRYRGINFTQDEQWFDGCNFTCVCENASRGLYKCRSRCPVYKALPYGCAMRRSSVDNCCLVPDCRYAAVVRGNKKVTTSRIFSTIQRLESMEKSMLKQMFNKRNKMRNELLRTDKDKEIRMKKTQNGPTVIKDSALDKRIHQNMNNFVKESSTNLQIDNRQLENTKQNINFKIPKRNRSIPKQEIVTPISVRNLGSNVKSGYTKARKEKKKYRHRRFRTIATQTGMYKVRKKDGIIFAYKQPVSKVFGKMLSVTLPGKTFKGRYSNSSEFCEYKDKRYTEGETWFDGCELLCFCQGGGRFVCNQRCPEYSRIPNGCSLIPPRVGQCCALLVCRRTPTRNNPPASYLNI
ncbi:uncharacterized protein MAL13P1.304-like [Mercenaria mercenaria]|uniref:uncharacterized protein MAL13P1.304-like n=1 Tax=Mercenaria mercenaria TaxID=6596 RepID=UPI00234F778E|nr:uncharacterized protein MAL13P1.304-like [Mercenaria mercenaria]